MKTTEFFKEIKKVAQDSSIVSLLDYSVNQDKRFYEIYLYSEPSERIKAMCEKNGFRINKTLLCKNDTETLEMQEWMRDRNIEKKDFSSPNYKFSKRYIWEVMPVDSNDFEYVANKEILHNVNPYVIIATDQAMIDAGLIKCNPRQDEITLWVYEFNPICKEMQWAPIMQVFATPLEDDIKDEDGRVIEGKSTHKIDAFYGAPVVGELDLRRYLVTRGVDVKPLKP